MSVPPERIVRRKLSDEVIDRLKLMITSGEMRPGDALPSERELMERFGVGRLPIREALQTLANMGLIVISHGERARVRELTAQSLMKQIEAAASIMLSTSPASLEHLKAARRFFEREMAREAAARAGPEDVAELRATLDRQKAHVGRPVDFLAADMRFHTQIAGLSGNPIYTAVSEAMLSWLKQYHQDLLLWSGREQVTLAEHEGIIARIAANDPDGAEAAMVAHLDRSADRYAHQRGWPAAEREASASQRGGAEERAWRLALRAAMEREASASRDGPFAWRRRPWSARLQPRNATMPKERAWRLALRDGAAARE